MNYFLIHQWKEKQRSTFWQKSIIVNILLAIIGVYFLLNVVFIGYFADKLITEFDKTADIIQTFSKLLFFYFTADLIIRFLFQSLPTLAIQPYLTLPIKKSKLLHFPLMKSLTSFFNILALLLLIPFWIKVICPSHSVFYAAAWLMSILSLIFTNNYLTYSVKKHFIKRPIISLFFILLWAGLLYTELSETTNLSGYFSSAFLFIARNPFFAIIPIAIAIITYSLAYSLLKKNTYLEDIQLSSRNNKSSFSFLSRYGETGNLIRLEIKMILRNKRPKSVLYISILFLLYGFLFYRKENMDNYPILFLAGFIITSMFAMNYGQFLFSWEGSYFDTFLVNRINSYAYLKSKYLFISSTCIISYLITLPFMLISPKIGLYNTAILIYNIGVSSFIMIFIATYNNNPIDIGRSQFMNYQGTGIMQFILIIPILGIPTGIYFLLKQMELAQYSFHILAIMGLLGILFNKQLLQTLTKHFLNHRYKMASAFRLN